MKYDLGMVVSSTKYFVSSVTPMNKTQYEKLYSLWYMIIPTPIKKSDKDKDAVNQQINSSRVYQFDVGVNMKGIVTLYKVNTLTFDSFIVNYSDRINTYFISITTKSVNSAAMNDNTTAQNSNS